MRLAIPEQDILDHYPFENGAYVLVGGGTNMGRTGFLKDTVMAIGRNKSLAIVGTQTGEEIRTSVEHVFVIGRDSPVVTIPSPRPETTLEDVSRDTDAITVGE